VFVHRVGRTARAGRKGWAWSFVTNTELAHLLDLQLFLARPLTPTASGSGEQAYIESLVLGTFGREQLDAEVETVTVLHEKNTALEALQDVMNKGQKMYERSAGKASNASYQRAKEMMKSGQWALAGTAAEQSIVHPILRGAGENSEEDDAKRASLLDAVNSFRPAETVFELGTRGKSGAAALMNDRRKALAKAKQRAPAVTSFASVSAPVASTSTAEHAEEDDIAVRFLRPWLLFVCLTRR